MTPRSPTPRPLRLACILGAMGAPLLLVGAVTGVDGVSVAGVVAGTMSLLAALFWRSELITAWRADHPVRQKGAGPARPGDGPRKPA